MEQLPVLYIQLYKDVCVCVCVFTQRALIGDTCFSPGNGAYASLFRVVKTMQNAPYIDPASVKKKEALVCVWLALSPAANPVYY